ncbi:Non-heme iron oxygenase ferredoxin subunit [Planctomycetales bacterium 10988]|nr:Non-heme iron oxygenase ferredoxin subunit [Planctomycetales bacterium 10988]
MSQEEETNAEEFITVAKVGSILEGQGTAVQVQGKYIGIFLHQGTYFAMDDQCPHQGAPLTPGMVRKGLVTCPWHGWRFALSDGCWIDNPNVKVPTYEVRVQGDEIQIRMPS